MGCAEDHGEHHVVWRRNVEGGKAAKTEKEKVRFKGRTRAGRDAASHLRENRDSLELRFNFVFIF